MIMAIFSETELVKSIRSGNILPCYMFWGRDSATVGMITSKLVKKLMPDEARDLNYHFFNPESFSLTELEDICESLPIFCDRVVVAVNDLNAELLRQDELKRLMDIISGIDQKTTTVIFYSTGVDLAEGKKSLSPKNKRLAEHISKCGGAVTEFGYKKPNELVKYINQRLGKAGCFMKPENAEYLASILGCSLLMINNECDKLSAYRGSGEIGRQDIELLVFAQADADAYKLSKAIVSGRRAESYDILDILYSRQAEPMSLASVISGAFMDLYRAKTAILSGKSAQEVTDDFLYKNRAFAVTNAFRDCRGMSLEKLRSCIGILSDCDRKMKSSRLDPRVLLEEAIARMLEEI